MLNLLYYDFLAVFKKLWYYVLIITGLAFVVRILWSEAFLTLFDNSNFFIGLVIRYVALGFFVCLWCIDCSYCHYGSGSMV